MMKNLFKTILALILILSQEACSQKADDEARFKEFWKEFARVVQAGDTTAFKKMSLEKISCFECLYNTEAEKRVYDSLNHKFQDSILYPLVSMPIEKFLKDDFTLVFNSNLKGRLNDESKLVYIITNSSMEDSSSKNSPYFNPILKDKHYIDYTTLVGFIDPSSTWEGMQYSFGFIETKEGFKLYGISTIP